MATHIAEQVSIDPRAEIDDDVEIGPFCVIGPQARIGRGTKHENNVTITGRVTLGEYNHVFPGVVIGGAPQDISYRGGDTEVGARRRGTREQPQGVWARAEETRH